MRRRPGSRPARTTAVAALLLAAGLALTGCGRLADVGGSAGSGDTGADTGAETLDTVIEELEAVDEALRQADDDLGAGDDAAGTDDEPADGL